MPTRIVVADAEPLFREGLADLLATQPDFEVVGEAADADVLVRETLRTQPDLVLLAVDLPCDGGQEAARRVREAHPDARVIMLLPPRIEEAAADVREHVHAVVSYGARAAQILDRVRSVAPPPDDHAFVRVPRRRRVYAAAVTQSLTPREEEVLALIARGWTNRQIEGALGIHNSTVKRHARHILRKLHVRNRVQAAVYAYRSPHDGA